MHWDPNSALIDFRTVAQLAGVDLSSDDVRVELLPAPHVAPTRLPSGMMAVYVFSHAGEVLKVGKVGPNSQARYTSQHYNAGSAMSTLAGSLMADSERYGLSDMERSDIGPWIKANIDRVNFLLKAQLGIPVLTLLESFLQCRLRPRYEGFKSQTK